MLVLRIVLDDSNCDFIGKYLYSKFFLPNGSMREYPDIYVLPDRLEEIENLYGETETIIWKRATKIIQLNYVHMEHNYDDVIFSSDTWTLSRHNKKWELIDD